MSDLPVSKNQDITLTIDALNSEGNGVGRVNGLAVFVPGALAGETVNAHVIKLASGYAIAKLCGVTTASEDRIVPPCASFTVCGGCTLQHLSYAAQLEYKQKLVRDALERIGGLSDITVQSVLGMDNPWNYRNKASFPISESDGRVVCGFYAQRSHRITPIEGCAIQDKRINAIPTSVCDWANRYGISAYNELTGKGMLRHVMVRTTDSGELMAVIVTTGILPHKDELIDAICACSVSVRSIIHNINPRNTNVILGDSYKTIYGSDHITETLCGMRFDVSAASFLQVNHAQTQRLYASALDALDLNGSEHVLDVYCGIGSISLLLAARACSVTGIESVPEAIADARKNAMLNGITNAEFVCGNAEDILPKFIENGIPPDAIVVDPPRKGCDPKAIDAIIRCNAQKLVYISCNPATLARDCKLLVEGGFKLKYIQPVDMFPHSSHVEVVILLVKE
ncbi:MAG: 23S rRNA (uracil(1939)-C(5))-methyltransferase RlmD [Clostridia bacterium]